MPLEPSITIRSRSSSGSFDTAAQIAADLGISESCLRNWVRQADVDEGVKEGLSTDDRAELVRLRREVRVKDMEIEILKRASAFFARENVLPK